MKDKLRDDVMLVGLKMAAVGGEANQSPDLLCRLQVIDEHQM